MDLSAQLQYESALLQLPLEIRNDIYKYAFYSRFMVSTHGANDIFARDRRYGTARRTRPRVYRKGLPYWIPSCKQIMAEALELVARTWSFEAMHRGFSRRAQVKPDDAKTDPIVFSRNVQRHIAVREDLNKDSFTRFVAVSRDPYVQKPTQAFLRMLKYLDMQNASLELRWSCWWHRPNRSETLWQVPRWLDGEPEMYTQDWDESWNGRFRKVKILVKFFADPSEGDIARELVAVAEMCAQRLVGGGGEASHQSYEVQRWKPKEKIWLRSVTVTRRV